MNKQVYDFISNQSKDPIIEWKECKISKQIFPIFESDLEFYEKLSPIFWWKKYNIPSPLLHPDLRHMRRMCFRNDRNLYHRKCDASWKNIISMFAQDKPYIVYERSYWWWDNWNALDYWMEFDFNRSFFEQFDELFKKVPLPALLNSNVENSDYVNQTDNMKNCYLEFSACNDENCYYWNRVFDCKYCLDCSVLYNSENCYECVDWENLYKCFYCQQSKNCTNCYFLFDCFNCSDCFGCFNLRNQKYKIFNKQYTEQEYNDFLKTYKENIKSYQNLEQLKNFFKQELNKRWIFNASYTNNCVNTFWWYLFNSKNTYNCYEWWEIEDCKYWLLLNNVKDIQDWNNSVDAEMQYEVSTGWLWWFRDIFCLDVWPKCTYLIYSAYCTYSSNLFWCIWLKNQEYCIFNKKYTKEQYEILVPKIIEHMQKTGEWWEFFPSSISPFWYNESAWYEYFPLEKELVSRYGFPWYEKDNNNFNNWKNVLHDNIDNINESILNQTITCTESWRMFKIISQELNFYKMYWLPIPRKHPDIRHLDRFHLKQIRDLHIINCKKCDKLITSIFDNNQMLKIYCEDCYKNEVY